MPEPSCLTKVILLGLSVARHHFSGKGISCRHVRACGPVAPDSLPFMKAQEEVQESLLKMVSTDACAKKISAGLRFNCWTKCWYEPSVPLLREASSGTEEKSKWPNREASKSQQHTLKKSDEVLRNIINVIKTYKIPLENFTQAFPSRCTLLMAWETCEEQMERNKASLQLFWTES